MTMETKPERSALERKDRDELLAIARAMGAAPPARARKADLVDLILEQVGVGSEPDVAVEAEAPAGGSTEAGAPAADGATDADAGDSRPRGRGRSTEREAETSGGDGGAEDDEQPKATTVSPATAGAVAGAATARATVPTTSSRPSPSRSRASSTCATRATASCASRVPAEPRRRLRVGQAGPPVRAAQGRPCSPARPGRPQREEPRPAAHRRGQRQDPEEARSGPASRTSRRCSPTRAAPIEDRLDPYNMTARIIDLIAPIGKGQRGLIVSPPKAGKTTVMKQIAKARSRPTTPRCTSSCCSSTSVPRRSPTCAAGCKGEVVASTFDRPADEHTAVAELTIERAKRMVEDGRDVVHHPRRHHPSGPGLQPGGPRHRADHVGRRRLRGAVPAEEVLRRGPQRRGGRLAHDPRHGAHRDRLQDGRGDLRGVQGHRQHGAAPRPPAGRAPHLPGHRRRRSSTRHEELLFDRKQLQQVWKLRRVLSGLTGEGGGGAAASSSSSTASRPSRATTSSSPRWRRVLHRQAEAGGLRWSGRALREALRPPQDRLGQLTGPASGTRRTMPTAPHRGAVGSRPASDD
jgi:transcription termination factor Rho